MKKIERGFLCFFHRNQTKWVCCVWKWFWCFVWFPWKKQSMGLPCFFHGFCEKNTANETRSQDLCHYYNYKSKQRRWKYKANNRETFEEKRVTWNKRNMLQLFLVKRFERDLNKEDENIRQIIERHLRKKELPEIRGICFNCS